MQPINIVFFPAVQLLLSLLLTVGATILFRKVRGWPALLLLIGSTGYLMMNAINTFVLLAMRSKWIPSSSPFWRHWSINLLDNVAGIATICLPVAIFWLALRAAPRLPSSSK